MKKKQLFITFLVLAHLTVFGFKTTQVRFVLLGLPYEAILRDYENPVANMLTLIRYNIFPNGIQTYQKDQCTNNNKNNPLNSIIGEGSLVRGCSRFLAINWSCGSVEFRTELDYDKTGFTDFGILKINSSSYLQTNEVGHEIGGYIAGNNGILWTDIKNFPIDHPTKPNSSIWYCSLEGPEAAVYERGTAALVNGEVFVPFSEHFGIVGNHRTMTVSLTPLSADSKGLAVIEKTSQGFWVQERGGGKGTYEFDWEGIALRTVNRNY